MKIASTHEGTRSIMEKTGAADRKIPLRPATAMLAPQQAKPIPASLEFAPTSYNHELAAVAGQNIFLDVVGKARTKTIRVCSPPRPAT